MKILNNRRRKNRIINRLREENTSLVRDVFNWKENLNYQFTETRELTESLRDKEDELIAVKTETEKMLQIKDRYYKLLKVIDINEEVRKVLEDEKDN